MKQPPVLAADADALSGAFDVFDKLDGHRLLLRRGEAYRRTRIRNEWNRLPHEIRDAAGDDWLDGELLAPGGAADDVGGRLAHGGPLEFRPFHIVGFVGDALAEHAELRLRGFNPPEYLGRFHSGELPNCWEVWRKRVAEGVVLRPVNGGAWLKLKRSETLDLPVVGFTNGNGRLAGSVGALVCLLPSGQTVKVGTGLDDRMRERLGGSDLGRVVEVGYQSQTNHGSLRHPRFLRWRDDLPVTLKRNVR